MKFIPSVKHVKVFFVVDVLLLLFKNNYSNFKVTEGANIYEQPWRFSESAQKVFYFWEKKGKTLIATVRLINSSWISG